MRVTVRVDGLREIDAALKELPKAAGKTAMRRVLKKRAEPIAEMMRSLAPDDPETGGKDLRNSIGVSTRLSPRQRRQHRKIDDRAGVEMFIGAGPLPQAHLQEFGTAHHAPQPFARPAWDAHKGALLKGIGADMWLEIQRATERLRRRAARLAARGG